MWRPHRIWPWSKKGWECEISWNLHAKDYVINMLDYTYDLNECLLPSSHDLSCLWARQFRGVNRLQLSGVKLITSASRFNWFSSRVAQPYCYVPMDFPCIGLSSLAQVHLVYPYLMLTLLTFGHPQIVCSLSQMSMRIKPWTNVGSSCIVRVEIQQGGLTFCTLKLNPVPLDGFANSVDLSTTHRNFISVTCPKYSPQWSCMWDEDRPATRANTHPL